MNTGSSNELKGKDMAKKYKVTLNEEQMRVTQIALEEYFRLRLGQEMDFADDIASMETDLSADNPDHRVLFDRYIARRDAISHVMKAVFNIAWPCGIIRRKTESMMTAETIWDAIRTARGVNRRMTPFQVGDEPIPEIEVEVTDDE